MQPLHFNTESARAAKQVMNQTYWDVLAEVHKLTAEVEALKPQWQARSADEFYMEYDEYQAAVRRQMETLLNLIYRLSMEISQWEEAAEHLG
jgi:uncharacterized protein YukE